MSSKAEIVKEFLDKTDIDAISKGLIQSGALMDISNDSIIKMSVSALSRAETIKAEAKRPKKYYLKNATKTQRKIHSMLIESTGTNIMDSGGDNGRSWQINRLDKNMLKRPLITYEASENNNYIECSIDVFHFLAINLNYTEKAQKLTERFYKFCKKTDESYYSCMDLFIEELTGKSVNAENTYNYDCNLSQGLQYINFEHDDYNYIILQTHNGADARGGYSKPVIFEIDDFFYCSPEIELFCDCLESYGTSNYNKEWKTIRTDPNSKYNCLLKCSECNQVVNIRY